MIDLVVVTLSNDDDIKAPGIESVYYAILTYICAKVLFAHGN
jgi:hypothetical protein